MTSISTIEEVSDATSLKVKEQYEQNPYPKWVATVLRQEPITVEKYFRKNTAVTSLEEIARIKSPEILVAGCGTGQHSITAAKRFENCRVTAIDLSLSSLAYAIRKTEEMKIDNINHLQADILDLQYLKHSFDIIECVGVLHHMEDPMLGWKTLVRHLRPHGLMKIGLYSELARKDLTKIRDQIETTKKNPLTDEIRSARQKIIESRNGEALDVLKARDFYSLSETRDLLFHVQEQQFTIQEIQRHLECLGLRFCGFDDFNLNKSLKTKYGDDADIYDLENWNKFEMENPKAFLGCINFGVKKADKLSML